MNVAILYGNLTRDPEKKAVKSDLVVATFGLAVNEIRKGESVAHFFEVTAFGKTAENVISHKKKGDPVIVRGRLQYESWNDKATGAKRTKVTVIAEQIQFVGRKNDRDGAAAGDPESDGFGAGSDDLREIPF